MGFSLDLFAILKAVWAVVSFALVGLLRVTWSDYKKVKDRLDDMDRSLIRMQSEYVTKDRLDDTIERKVKHIQSSIQDIRNDVGELRRDIKTDVKGLREDMQQLMQLLLKDKS